MTKPLDFQSIMLTLQAFWAEKGCLVWQPYHTEVGAGTMNPATSLRVLGPEPWNVAYVEPSIRPDDGRYGKNPNRFYQHTQFQVILKPDPGNPQELYLESLVALGIDPREHDIRFVEDNWESPALGAWGLGWEVWLDGLEITQFTYFQQSGGQTLDPVSVELTYGLERIAMAIQGVRDFRDIRWNDHMTYGDVNLQSEQEFSKYSFELADVDRLRQLFDIYEAEAKTALEHNQVLPAHDYVLKCSQAFNILDTRGAVGVTERQGFFRRMRGLSRAVAKAYYEQRQHLEFPWLDEDSDYGMETEKPVTVKTPKLTAPTTPTPFLLEIGTEELPTGDILSAISQLEKEVPAMLKEARLEFTGLKVYSTPRRLVVYIEQLAAKQDDLEQLVKGPPTNRAFDEDGSPTRAAEGFARSKGLDVSALEIREIDGGSYAAAVVRETGEPSTAILYKALPGLIGNLRFGKTMRWNASNVAFSRPIRWLVAMHGEHEIAFEFADYQAGKTTRGLRFYEPAEIIVNSPAEYFDALSKQGIILDQDKRKVLILEQIKALAEEVGGEVLDDPALFSEVTYLVEAVTATRGKFNPEHLKLPDEVLISVMKKHQRYFPVVQDGKLLPYFITVRNGDDRHLEVVTEGNADVIRARFADAAYFVKEDIKTPLVDYLPLLDKLTFQADLGSMLDKSKRIEKLVAAFSPGLGLSDQDLDVSKRAAHLCKADLATQMVVEMTSLQGTMGRDYALISGENDEVAKAIFEHYLPRHAEDAHPAELAGLVIGIADRLDTLSGLFAAGLAPSGNKDPFAQRRAALGLVSNLIKWDLDFDLQKALETAAGNLPIEANTESQEACLVFIKERLRNNLLDEGYRYDIVDAVITEQGHNPAKAVRAAQELTTWVKREDWETILPAYSRCVRITRDLKEQYQVNESQLVEEPTKVLYKALARAEKDMKEPGSVDDFLTAFIPMIPAVDKFFDDVLVMAEDETVKQNRLGLLQRIASLAKGAADLSKLEGF